MYIAKLWVFAWNTSEVAVNLTNWTLDLFVSLWLRLYKALFWGNLDNLLIWSLKGMEIKSLRPYLNLKNYFIAFLKVRENCLYDKICSKMFVTSTTSTNFQDAVPWWNIQIFSLFYLHNCQQCPRYDVL